MRSPALRIPERLLGDLPGPLAEDLGLDGAPGLGSLGGQVGVGDRGSDCVAVAAARHPADDIAVHPDGLGAERNRTSILEDEACGTLERRALASRRASSPDEVAFVELDGEVERRLVRRLVGGDVGAPEPVALFEPEQVDRLVAAGDEARSRPASQIVSQRRRPYSMGQ